MSGETPNADLMRDLIRQKFDEVTVKLTDELKVAFRETRIVLPDLEGEEEQMERLKQASGAAVADSIDLSPTREEGSFLRADITIDKGTSAQILRVWGDQDPLLRWKNRLGRSQ